MSGPTAMFPATRQSAVQPLNTATAVHADEEVSIQRLTSVFPRLKT